MSQAKYTEVFSMTMFTEHRSTFPFHIAVSLHNDSDYCKWPKLGVGSLGLLFLSFFNR